MDAPLEAAVDLAGPWALRDAGGEHAITMTLPGDVITALHQAGVIPDPYWGRNEEALRWIGERDWTLERSFTVSRTDLALVIGELDTVAEVVVNGQSVLSARNAFRRYRVDLCDVLQLGENTITLAIRSPIKAAAEEQARQPFFVPYHTQNNPLENGNMLRKQQCDFGWDWNIALAPSGVYGAILLEPANDLRIEAVRLAQSHRDNTVDVRVSVDLAGDIPPDTPYAISLPGCRESGTVPAGSTSVEVSLTIDNPELWWPAGLGAQTLHTLQVEVGGATARRRIGLRDLRLVSEPDAVGRSFGFRINGHDVFARGANWIPADALAGRITPQAVRSLLQSAVDANMNMIRVWGGGRYEPDWFYDLCDELGLMVWQDFMFACNLYPCTDDFLCEVDQEVREVVARLQHHACLALWCGDNELIGALTWFPESRKDRDRYLVAYDRLNRTVETGLKAVDPDANWWPSSPSPGPVSFGDAWHDDSSGDMHSWAVWHEGRDFDHYRELTPRFASEFGFQSYPSMATIACFAGPDDLNIASPVMESHQKNGGGNARIAETMFRSFRFPVDFESFVYVSQVQQAIAIRTAVTHWRALKPHCMGTLYWQLNDSWPVCSWSSLNHGGSWKLLHHAARHFYAPVMATVVPQGESLHIKAVNDTRRPAQLHLEALALAMDGTTRRPAAQNCEIPTDRAVTALTLERAVLSPNEMLLLRWQDATGQAGSDLYTPQPFKAYDLPDPQVRIASTKNGETHTLTLNADAPAFFVMVEADVPGRFSDNGVHLLPGEPVSITFTPDAPDGPIRFSHQDLFSATCSRAPDHHAMPERIFL